MIYHCFSFWTWTYWYAVTVDNCFCRLHGVILFATNTNKLKQDCISEPNNCQRKLKFSYVCIEIGVMCFWVFYSTIILNFLKDVLVRIIFLSIILVRKVYRTFHLFVTGSLCIWIEVIILVEDITHRSRCVCRGHYP